MILSIFEKYIRLSISRIKLERIFKNAVDSREGKKIDQLNNDLMILNESIDFLYKCIINRISLMTSNEITKLYNVLKKKEKEVKEKLDVSNITLNISTQNREVALVENDIKAVNSYDKIISELALKIEQEIEELNCYKGALRLCYKMGLLENYNI